MDVDEILQKLLTRYASCSSYRDSGRVQGSEQGQTTFRTFFLRPHKFRFEWTYVEPPLGYSFIWCDGNKVFSFNLGEKKEENSLSNAIAAATGVLQGTAHTIPTLLLPELDASFNSLTLPKLGPYQLANEEEISGKHAFRIFSEKENERIDLWIEKSTFALVKYAEWSRSTPEIEERILEALATIDPESADKMRQNFAKQSEEDRISTTTVTYEDPKFDEPIANEEFTNFPWDGAS